MKKLLLSIKPQFVDEIKKGNKVYEYRKTIFKDRDVNSILIYCSSPVKKIVAECIIEDVISASPEEVWKQTKQHGGIDEIFFKNYFQGRDIAYAIKMKDVTFFSKPLSLAEIGLKKAPQSFCYIEL